MSYGSGRGRGYGGGGRFGRGQGRGGGRGGSRAPRKYDARKIFVGGVSRRDSDSASFEEFFSAFGELEDIILMKAVDGSGHRGFGFVTFKDQKVTDSVLARCGDLELDGRPIDVKMALPEELKPPEGVDGKKIFIGSLPKEDFDSEDLKEYFGQWGTVSDSWVSPGRGFGFISYETSNGAYKALIHGSNQGHTIGNIQVSAKWPIPKESVRQVRDAGFDRGFARARGSSFDPWESSRGGYANESRFEIDRYAARSYPPERGYQDFGRRRYQDPGRDRYRPY